LCSPQTRNLTGVDFNFRERICGYGRDMEKRAIHRSRVLKAGTIEFGGGAVNCVVRNMSIKGAALDVASPVGIPASFTLVFRDDGVQMPCHIVWRKEKRIGVEFD